VSFKVEQIRSEDADNAINPARELMERLNNLFTPSQSNFIESYAKGEFEILLHLRSRNGEEYFAHLQREGCVTRAGDNALKVGGCLRGGIAPHKDFCEVFTLTGQQIVVDEGTCGRKQQTMLVDVVEAVETPQQFIPSLIWLQRIDLGDVSLSRSLYFSSELRRCVLLQTFGNGKSGEPTWYPSIHEDELPYKMVKSRTEVLNSVSSDSGDREGNVLGTEKTPLHIPRMSVVLEVNAIGVAIEKEPDSFFELLDVLIGPVGFDSQPVERISHADITDLISFDSFK
jgi:hypothetical protein